MKGWLSDPTWRTIWRPGEASLPYRHARQPALTVADDDHDDHTPLLIVLVDVAVSPQSENSQPEMSNSRTSSLSPPRSVTPPGPVIPAQPDHFFGSEGAHLPPSPHSDARPWLHPNDDPLAHRGIPVFKPTMDEFADFEGYMTKIECWGLKSGIVKVIPPKEWVDALPPVKDQLAKVKIRSPIEQLMVGRGGLFRQQNVEKRRNMSVREWAELCNKEEFRAPGVDDVGLHARNTRVGPRPAKRSRASAPSHNVESVEPEEMPQSAVKEERGEMSTGALVNDARGEYMSPPTSVGDPGAEDDGDRPADVDADQTEENPKQKGKRTQTREAREAQRAAKDAAFIQVFDPNKDWLPPGTSPEDYTVEFCQKLERQFWRNCSFGRPPWYGADSQGSLYTDETKIWNVGHLPSFLSRLLPASNGLPGVNLPYLYFGMWRATFAWHVEDMDLFSINYIHFGAPKFWYAVPQGRAAALEATMKSYFPKDTSECPQFLRHKSFLASPTLLAQSSCRPNFLVQREHEFVITYPRGYHAGFNLGFNCAESVNFALESWIELGRKAKACRCVADSVRIDVDQLLRDMQDCEAEIVQPPPSSKRKAEGVDGAQKRKRPKPTVEPRIGSAPTSKVSVTLRLGPKPPEPEGFPCCLCVSMSQDGLSRVQDPPIGKRELPESLSSIYDGTKWMAHEECAKVVPETWVDTVESAEILPDGSHVRESRVFGVDAIVKDRWNLKCSACTKGRQKAHGAPIQCTKGKCTKSFHVSCAREGRNGISYTLLREVEKEVILIDMQPASSHIPHTAGEPSQSEATAGLFVAHAAQPDAEPRVLKTIKKNEVQVLCNQHNPAVAAAKKANKQDKIRNELLALPSMSRIKIRVSAGVFEVSLLRVIEETGSIEVLWDRGIKREFKWGSVVFGQTDGQTVMQKPSEPAPEPVPQRSKDAIPTLHVATFPSAESSSSSSSTSAATPAPGSMYMPAYPYQPSSAMYATGSWPYQVCQPPPQQIPYSLAYTYPGYYPAAMQTTCRSPAESSGAQGTYRSPLQWQQPYIGPRTNGDPTGSSGQAHPTQS
ncbi:JmjC domain, hydroxylase-domain-containing protein [Boletus reticuloceps]|uniref:[histone H3]-trimethyl-L-lysine(9) demethylase n=1 Tax=Boletus reticuloceps TaxID=495285 RepID=A0A8I2YID5_9AGAM|nr:JmjC domain, hydroxylase-domain-containing protein [Boletus reticuloceps]